MKINFSIDFQSIQRSDNEKIAANSKGILYAEFTFDPSWDKLIKKAVFERNKTAYCSIIIDGCCLVPEEILEEGTFFISVIGVDSEESIRATTEAIPVEVAKGPRLSQANAAVPTPTEIEQLTTLAGMALKTAEEVKSMLGSQGPSGTPGYTPQRGVDYWTEADKQEIKSYVNGVIEGIEAELAEL